MTLSGKGKKEKQKKKKKDQGEWMDRQTDRREKKERDTFGKVP